MLIHMNVMIFNIMIAHIPPANQRTGVKRANIITFAFSYCGSAFRTILMIFSATIHRQIVDKLLTFR